MSARILVVDDEPSMVSLVSQRLTSQGYEVLTALSGECALDQARRGRPDLVLLDIKMDGLDGLTVCEILRREAMTARTPIVLMSGAVGQLARYQGLASGATDFLLKPFTSEELLARIQAALDGRSRDK